MDREPWAAALPVQLEAPAAADAPIVRLHSEKT